MRSPVELTQAFRSRGLKVTPQRQCIFRILHRNETHPTAEAVYRAAVGEMPTISLRTVYQTLNDLAEMGEIHALHLGTGSTRFDPNLVDHHHLVCKGCGSVRDVELDAPAVAGGFGGFEVQQVQIVLRGRCAECSEPARPHPHPPTNQGASTHG